MDDGIQAKIVEIEQRSKSNTHRINDLEEDNRALHQLATSVEVLALRGDITGKDFLTIFLMVITFYFGTQSQKAQDAMDAKGDDNGTEN